MNQNFLDMLSAFLEEHVDFMIVGAFALSAYGYTRATGDLDFWIGPGPTNGDKVLRALVTFGAPVGAVTAADFADPDVILQIGVEPERIDILTSIDGVGYAEAHVRRSFVEIAGMSVPVIGIDELIANKKATGRPKDQADVIELEKARKH